MPNYDLQCEACQYEFEAFQKMDAQMPSKCPSCGNRKARRVFRKAVAVVDTYPDGHPRKNRGRGH